LPAFINLHTHRKPQLADELVIRNAYHNYPKNKLEALPYPVSAGIHPWQLQPDFSLQLNQLEKIANQDKVIAIGECGLDRVKGTDIEIQVKALKQQLQIANQLNKPLILHLVKSYSDILAHANSIHVPWIIHGFKGNLIEANRLIQKGACLSFGPRLLVDYELQRIFKSLPLKFVYLETDTKPMLISEMYRFAASLRNIV
jgi:TatD DNase family protein